MIALVTLQPDFYGEQYLARTKQWKIAFEELNQISAYWRAKGYQEPLAIIWMVQLSVGGDKGCTATL
jgi:hypothetical protein